MKLATFFIILAFTLSIITFCFVGAEYVFQEKIVKRCVASNWTDAFEYNNKIITCLPNHSVMVTNGFGERQVITIINFGGN